MKFHIETKRLILRDIQTTDVDAMFELDSNPLVHKYLGNNPITSRAEAKTIIGFIMSQYKDRGIGRFAVIEKSSGDFIGWSGLKYNTGDSEALGDKRDFYDIGYRLIPKYWGKGYATESAKAALDFGFNTLQLPLICGAAEVDNIASNTILLNLGLQYKSVFQYNNKPINWYELNTLDYAKTMS